MVCREYDDVAPTSSDVTFTPSNGLYLTADSTQSSTVTVDIN
jgi:hypothetical protein